MTVQEEVLNISYESSPMVKVQKYQLSEVLYMYKLKVFKLGQHKTKLSLHQE